MEKHQESNGKKTNAGYEIIQNINLGARQFVVGHHPKAPSPYVTWEYFAERDSYYQGHYFTEPADATLDMFRRASEDLSFDGKSLGYALLPDEDRTNLFLEFRDQNAKEDIANALAEELEDQELAYAQKALLADPDFMSRAMFHYDRLDHGYENEALRDEIAMILNDYPQYIVSEQENTLNLFPEQRELIVDLLTLPTTRIPEKYGPLGDNISFTFELANSNTAVLELVPDSDLLDRNKLSETSPHFVELTIYDASGSIIICENNWGQDISKAAQDKNICFQFKESNLSVTLTESESLRRTGNAFIFQSNSEDERYTQHNGEVCKIQRALTAKECDILCSGFMWVAEFPNGDVLHVFDDELTTPEPEQILKTPLSQQIQNAQDKTTDSKQEPNQPEQSR